MKLKHNDYPAKFMNKVLFKTTQVNSPVVMRSDTDDVRCFKLLNINILTKRL